MQFQGLTLDKFQEDAINAIEQNQSVVVSAPTGSGKTLIADYIIDRDIKRKKRVVYTAPIKALSNQKYADFVKAYGAETIGLLTGDIVINPTAQILIMTTEIYRNMVVVNDNILDTLSYVIFDEIHYISDIERGHIWEESIIFSPEHVRFLCLSATIPNAQEFASWIQKIKKHTVLVVEHKHRPVPLEKLFYDTTLGIASLKDIFEQQELDKYPSYDRALPNRGKKKKDIIPSPEHTALIGDLTHQKMLPAIFFTFSRVDCQKKAQELGRNRFFLSKEQSQEVRTMVHEHLQASDARLQKLDSTRLLKDILPKGIGFHHAGLLPALKHLVEKLFSQKLIYVLYATETFAVGINMPAKTVCFNSLRKFDGLEFRYLNSKEYFQLAGRAGRRGIDEKGMAIAMIHRQFDDLKRVRKFTASDTDPIKSQFKLSCNTVINLIAGHSRPEIHRILEANFYCYQRGKTELIERRFENIESKLQKMRYVENGILTQKGQFIRNIFVDEIVVGEVFGTTFFQDLNEYQVLLLIAALVFEPRAGVQLAPPIVTKDVKELIRKVQQHSYLKRLKKMRNITAITALIHPCYEGEKFLQLLDYSNMLEGDMLRFLRQLVDRLQQIRKASTEFVLDQVVSNCMVRIDQCLEGIDIV